MNINEREFASKNSPVGDVAQEVYAGGVVKSPPSGTVGCFAIRAGREIASCLIGVGTEDLVRRFKQEYLMTGCTLISRRLARIDR